MALINSKLPHNHSENSKSRKRVEKPGEGQAGQRQHPMYVYILHSLLDILEKDNVLVQERVR